MSYNNPFSVISPEQLNAEQVKQQFIEWSSDFPQVRHSGHSLIIGSRGSGKSMMFRTLLPDVVKLREGKQFCDLDFVAFHIPLKNTQLKITDLRRLDNYHGAYIINEHFITISVIIEVLKQLEKISQSDLILIPEELNEFLQNIYMRRLKLCRCTNLDFSQDVTSPEGFFRTLYDHAYKMLTDVLHYITMINPDLDEPLPPYNLPVLSFNGFIVPFLQGLKELSHFPNKEIYLFIDDADNLSVTQTKILNSWLSTRTSPAISLKVSAQIGNYKSFVTPNGIRIESPHDFQEVNITDRYTTSQFAYKKHVKKILARRMELAGIVEVTPDDFFPPYKKQEDAIIAEANRLKENWKLEGRGNRPDDDALRYARPNYIKKLGGMKKARSKYRYAGLDQIIHVSSGVIRYCLDAASIMYDETIKYNPNNNIVKYIPDKIQDKVIRNQAEQFMFSCFTRLEKDEYMVTGASSKSQRLQNLIFSMGYTFHDFLVSDRSERRVFSFALSNKPTPEITEVLEFGVQTGYLHMSSIGNKDGTGKTWLYIMNRCLAPIFTLDPTGFAGYLFVTNETLIEAMTNGRLLRLPSELVDLEQLTIFD
jgi:hypothetical protein